MPQGRPTLFGRWAAVPCRTCWWIQDIEQAPRLCRQTDETMRSASMWAVAESLLDLRLRHRRAPRTKGRRERDPAAD